MTDIYQFFPVSVLRTPAFSYKTFSLKNIGGILKSLFFQRSILIASSALYKQLEKVDFDLGRIDSKTKFALKKYLNRICFRTTPFGIFSNFSVVQWGLDTSIELCEQNIHITKSFAEKMATGRKLKKSIIDKNLRYACNGTIYKIGKGLRYFSFTPNESDTALEFSVNSVTSIPILEKLLSYLKQKTTYSKLLEYLTETLEIENAEQLINELIKLQFLVDELNPNITGKDFLEIISSKVGCNYIEKDYKGTILSITDSQLSLHDAQLLTNTIKDSRSIYVNLERVINGSIPINFQEPILKALNCLYWVNSTQPADIGLEEFKRAYTNKFEGQILPLLQVLDPEAGIGYKNLTTSYHEEQLLKDIDWQHNDRDNEIISWSPVHALLLQKWKNKSKESFCKKITITEDEIATIPNCSNRGKLPQTISVIFRIVDDKIIIEGAGGATATSLIGRFTLFNEQIKNLAFSIAEKEIEFNPNIIFAEIVHLCDFHTANINRRQTIYQYEIPVLTQSEINEEFQIPLSDLWVSVVNGIIVLQSRKHNKRVIPRLSSAFNYSRNNLSVFRFLCDLQHQELCSTLGFDLNNFFPGLNYYPRVEFLNTILFLATWRISKDQWKFLENSIDEREWKERFKKDFKSKLHLPQWIAITVHDNHLVFNLNKPDHIDFFFQSIKDQDTVIIKEYISSNEKHTLVMDKFHKPFINQFVAALYHEKKTFRSEILPIPKFNKVTRKMPPGSEWLYLKIYCHPSCQNGVIGNSIFSLISKIEKDKTFIEWFFVRYIDSDHHIRLRIKTLPENVNKIFPLICKHLTQNVKKKEISYYEVATYERELERYGHKKIELFESVFYASSKLVMYYFRSTNNRLNELKYEIFALQSVRTILNCFQINDGKRILFLKEISDSFLVEFDNYEKLKYQLDLKFRQLKNQIDDIVLFEDEYLSKLGVHKANNEFIQSLNLIVVKLKNNSTRLIIKWVKDIIHMHLNRLFVEERRKQEMIVYYILYKYEKSVWARKQETISI